MEALWFSFIGVRVYFQIIPAFRSYQSNAQTRGASRQPVPTLAAISFSLQSLSQESCGSWGREAGRFFLPDVP